MDKVFTNGKTKRIYIGKMKAVLGWLNIEANAQRKITTDLSSTGYWWVTQNIKERRN